MVNIGGVEINLPGWELIIFFVLIFLFLLSGIITAFVISQKLRWPYKVNILENVSGSGYVPTRKDRARLVKFGDGGEEIFLLKRMKKYRTAYGKRIGARTIAWAIGTDGYWYNVTFGDLDKKLLEVGVIPVDRDMRLANSSIRKGIDIDYKQKNFMDKYGTIIAFGMLLMCIMAMGGFIWFAMKQVQEANQANLETTRTSKEVMELARQVLSSLDNIKEGSGITVLTWPLSYSTFSYQ